MNKSQLTHLSGSNFLRVSSEPKLYLFGSTVYCRTSSQLQVDHSCSCPAAVYTKVLNSVVTGGT